MPPQILENRIAVVTGASTGIGRVTAELLATRGARVVVFGRSAERLRDLVSRHEGRMLAVTGDVADADAIDKLFAECEARFGHCDLLVNNAGMIDPKAMIDTAPEEWDRMFAVNVHGVYLASRRALRPMMAKRA